MHVARLGKIMTPVWWSKLDYKAPDGQYLLSLAVGTRREVPVEMWPCKPDEYVYDLGGTMAMMYAMRERVIPENLRHDPKLKSAKGRTVADIYKSKGMTIPVEWCV